ncbi:transglycosylase domain-containing protein [Virgibacillus salinus]|uniref:Penicillin-binding protein 2A n=1 Tax=Virgibacillus salinus TaxID=553311 RepID=A0A1H1ED96_9BACI|nr:PBP1A family penicillin-binding protein [Virgibacillus salinus]SDQ86725.1 penicillin-binding protein 2A [Virgibacillus salinus]
MHKSKSSIRKKMKWLLISSAFILIVAIIGYTAILFGGNLVVDEEELILDATTTIETSDGNIIGKLYNENRIPVNIEEIPGHVTEAFVAVEDRRFYDHGGVDFQSVVRAVYRDIIAMAKVEGASTITQQLAKNLFLHNDKTWMRKTKEVMAAIHLERKYSKDEILELYLNEIYFGQGLYGIETASQTFFSKSVKDLNVTEGALLAGLAKAPNGYSPVDHPKKAKARRNVVLKAMDDTGKISTEKRMSSQGKTLGLKVKKNKPNPWTDSYNDLVLQEAKEEYNLSNNELKRGGYRIVVNMNEKAQQIAYKKFKNGDYFPGNTKGVQGAFVMMEQDSGKIVAAIGGRDYQLGDLNRVTVNRQPGSTMKPIAVYGPAMMQEAYQPYTLIRDQKMEINGYTATNYDGNYEGAVSIFEALIESKNASAVWLLNELGVSNAKDYLTKMDITVPDEGLAIALGGLSEGLTPLKMAESYTSFARNGETIDSFAIDKIYDKQNEVIFQGEAATTDVFSPQVAWNMTSILTEAVNEGTASAGEYSKALAGKTGSTQHPHVADEVKDAWFVGYTPQYVSALWMGYDTSDKEHYLTGGSEYPTKLTKAILSELDKEQTLTATFKKPENVKDLPKPIKLPEEVVLNGDYSFGGFSLFKGKLQWTPAKDDRVVYHIYQEKEGVDERIGKVEEKNEFTVNNISIFKATSYYVVPYDPLTKREGNKSNTVTLSM